MSERKQGGDDFVKPAGNATLASHRGREYDRALVFALSTPVPLSRFVMKFVHTTGQQLAEIVKDDEIHQGDLAASGVKDQTIVRINVHGDIEVRRTDRWDVIGGLLGDFEHRIKRVTGLDFA